MGKLFEYKNIIEEKVKNMGADAFKVKGQIGIKAGILIGSIDANTPDDPAKVQALRAAIKEVLGIAV
jgi:hypothetical protein